jgi:DNA-binding beta-propeller fold protein YncE
MYSPSRRGFTLIELLIFSGIFSLIIGAFITTLVVSVNIQASQSASGEAQQQGQFLIQQLQSYIESARLVDMVQDVSASTLVLREQVASSSSDPTIFTLSGGMVYLQQGVGATPQPLTSKKVTISNLLFTRHYSSNSPSSAFGTDSVSYSFTISSNAGNQPYSQSFQSSASVLAPVGRIALIQQGKAENNSGSSVSSLTEAFPTNNESGDLLIAVVAYQGVGTSSVADTNGNGWTRIASTTTMSPSGTVSLYDAPASLSGANSVTATFGSGATYASVMVYEYRGAATESPFDVYATQAQAGISTPTSPSVSPAGTAELLFGVDDNSGPTSATFSSAGGYALESSSTAGNTTQVFVEDTNQYITNPVAASWRSSVLTSSSAMIATFKGGSSGPIAFTTSTIAVGPIADGLAVALAFDSHTNSIWAVNQAYDGTATQINDTAPYATSTYAMGSNPLGAAFDSHTNSIWVVNAGGSTGMRINDTAPYATSTYDVGLYPAALAFDSHTNSIWVAGTGYDWYGDVTQINDTAPYATSTIALGPTNPEAVAFDSHTNSIWVVNQAYDGTVTQINDTAPYATSTYAVGGNPRGIAFDSHTNSIWVVNRWGGTGGNTVTQINDTAPYATSTYAVGSDPEAVAFDSHTNSIWVTNTGDDTVTQINDTTYATSTYAVGSDPEAVAFDSHTNSILVENLGDGTVTQFAPSH